MSTTHDADRMAADVLVQWEHVAPLDVLRADPRQIAPLLRDHWNAADGECPDELVSAVADAIARRLAKPTHAVVTIRHGIATVTRLLPDGYAWPTRRDVREIYYRRGAEAPRVGDKLSLFEGMVVA